MASKGKMVKHYEMEISSSYLKKIKDSQEITSIVINGKPYERIRFGDEGKRWEAKDWAANAVGQCGDCAVAKGEFHVVGCDIETCPSCGGQAIGCNCEYEGDDE